MQGATSVGYWKIFVPPTGISPPCAITCAAAGRERYHRRRAYSPPTRIAPTATAMDLAKLRRVGCGLAAGSTIWRLSDVAYLEAGLQEAEDGVAGDHADDVVVRDDRHLVDVLALHALENAHGGFFWRGGVDFVHGQHHGLNRSVLPLVAGDGAGCAERHQPYRGAGSGHHVATAARPQHLVYIFVDGHVASYCGDVAGHDVFCADACEHVPNGDARGALLCRGQQEPSDERKPQAAHPVAV